ncbi:MAG: hypothetical protein H6729_17615 [Deltaproteobacteria bacterium]|nr:hypothetical protein [Deltaproteobacteria bacterium]
MHGDPLCMARTSIRLKSILKAILKPVPKSVRRPIPMPLRPFSILATDPATDFGSNLGSTNGPFLIL